jgi:endonuclease/exonuclease/phosphatase family metal-dependent hydrolase
VPPLRLLSVRAHDIAGDRAALAALIEQAGVDLACVHGSPSLLRWRSISAALARQANLVVVGGGRTGGGNLLLSTLGVDVTGLRDLAFTGTSGLRPPGATLAVLALRGSEFVAAGARLGGSAADRLAQAEELETALAGMHPGRPPALLSVDGVEPGTPAWDRLAAGRTAVGGGVFVDTRIEVGGVAQPGGRVRVELDLPAAAPVE